MTPSRPHAISTSAPSSCQWCGATHQTKCPLVKAIEYHEDGRVNRVEFMTANDYPPLGQPVAWNTYHCVSDGHTVWQVGPDGTWHNMGNPQ